MRHQHAALWRGEGLEAAWARTTGHDCYTERLAEAGLEPSVGSKGDSYDNALAECINGLYKAELIYRQSWMSREAVEIATLKWGHWHNHHRLGDIPSAEAEANFHQQSTVQPMAT